MLSKKINWHSLNLADIYKKLDSSKNGLIVQEAKKRLSKYKPNVLAEDSKFSPGRLFLSQFKSALVYVLLVAGLVSIFFGEIIDVYVIFAAVLLNVVVGFIQEYKANKSLDKLNKVVKHETVVIRNGHEQKVESRDLAPGDVIILKAGDRVSADARLIQVNDVEVNEASLTGESWPVKKQLKPLEVGTVLAERSNMVFMGTLVVDGKGQAIITDTGLNTEMGRITALLKETKEEKTPLQNKLDSFAQNITKIVVAIAFLIFILGLLQGYEWSYIFTVSVAVAVSAIPEGLVISMTMILTVGMQRILKNNGLVRKLISAETLGSTTIICTDKTGTLTEGEMKVTNIITHSYQLDLATDSLKDIKIDKELQIFLQIAVLCNDSIIQNEKDAREDWMVIGTPTEKALLLFGAQGKDVTELRQHFIRLEEITFDSQRKYMVTRHNFDKQQDIVFLKGAPEKILSFSENYLQVSKTIHLTTVSRKYFQDRWETLSKRGLRVLAGAYKIIPKNFKGLETCKEQPFGLTFVGIWGLSDPIRPEAKETLKKTLSAGINTIIITGDNKFTAHKIAQDLGLNVDSDNIITGDELLKIDDKELDSKIRTIKVYARVTPADKLRIVKAWQKKGEVVSMTGDGINDAPALKAADIGVVVSSGSDVAKETADLVLLDNNFNTIVMAIKQGRVIFANIRKVILYLLADSFSEIIIVVGSLFFRVPLPLVAAQILWVNLVGDGFPALALTMEPEDKEIMDQGYKQSKSLLNFENKFLIATISVVTGVTSLWLFHYFWHKTGDIDLARTVTFTALGIDTLFFVFSIKNLRHSIFSSKPFLNKYLNAAVLMGFIIQLAAVYLPVFNKFLRTEPLGWTEWEIILVVIISTLVIIEIIKAVFIYYQRKIINK